MMDTTFVAGVVYDITRKGRILVSLAHVGKTRATLPGSTLDRSVAPARALATESE